MTTLGDSSSGPDTLEERIGSRDRRYILELRLAKEVCANYQGINVCMFRKRKKLSDLSVADIRSIVNLRQERRQRPCVRIGAKSKERSS